MNDQRRTCNAHSYQHHHQLLGRVDGLRGPMPATPVEMSARPTAPPICAATFTTPDAAPESCGRAPSTPATVSGVAARPWPAYFRDAATWFSQGPMKSGSL